MVCYVINPVEEALEVERETMKSEEHKEDIGRTAKITESTYMFS